MFGFRTPTLAMLAVILAGLFSSQDGSAAVVVTYDYASGRIRIINEGAGTLAAIIFYSTTGALTSAEGTVDIAGATKETSELPYALSYLSFPAGQTDLGLLLPPGLGDSTATFGLLPGDVLYVKYYKSLSGPAEYAEMWIPEPSSFLLATLGAVTLARCSRQRSRMPR